MDLIRPRRSLIQIKKRDGPRTAPRATPRNIDFIIIIIIIIITIFLERHFSPELIAL